MQAAHRTKGTSSTRCAVIWLVQNQLQGTCKAVTLLLVVLPPDFALPLQFDYAKSRKCHQSSPSLSFTTLHIFTVVGETNCVEKKKKKGSSGIVGVLFHELLYSKVVSYWYHLKELQIIETLI